MTDAQDFRIRRSFLFPLGLLLALIAALLVVSQIKGEPVGKGIILCFIMLPVGILFVESAFRKIVLTAEGIVVYKLLRKKALRFEALTSLDTVRVRKRVFLTLCAGDDFLILSNAYADFPALVKRLLDRIPSAVISDETRQMSTSPPVKSTDVVSCWLAVALLAFILYVQLAG